MNGEEGNPTPSSENDATAVEPAAVEYAPSASVEYRPSTSAEYAQSSSEADPSATASGVESVAEVYEPQAATYPEATTPPVEPPTESVVPPTESVQPPTQPNARQQLVRQFEQWLDRMSEVEPPPDGIPPDILAEIQAEPSNGDNLEADLYTVTSALTALSGEIGLQGRAFKSLTDTLAPVGQVPARLERIDATQTAIAQELARCAAAERKIDPLPAAGDVLAVLFDVYDRLERALDSFDDGINALRSTPPPTGWRQRLFGPAPSNDHLLESTDALRKGYQLALSRLQAAWEQWGIERIGQVGEPFDPAQMAVIDVAPADARKRARFLKSIAADMPCTAKPSPPRK